LVGCTPRENVLRAEYEAALASDGAAYSGDDARVAYREKQNFIRRVEELERQAAPVAAKDLYIWDVARLGLLAEHLGMKEEASRHFSLASRNARKAYPNDPESKTSEAALRAALEEMDSPDKFPWRKNRPNKAPEPTPGAVTPRATEGTPK